ncbi:hypothetical protein ScPMuIL_014394 [Solemya velum]
MQLFQAVLILSVACYRTSLGHGSHGHDTATPASTHNGIPDKPVDFHDPKVTQDQAHLKEHLKDEVDTDREMTPQEMEFHYFRLHDANNDTQLDGLEILAALSHMVPIPEIQAHEKVGKTEEQIEMIRKERNEGMLKYYTDIVDRVLIDDDYNHDGYVSYTEFAMARRRDEHRYQQQLVAQQYEQQMAMQQQQMQLQQQQQQFQQWQQWQQQQQLQQQQQQQKPGQQQAQLSQQFPPGVPPPQLPQQQKQYPEGMSPPAVQQPQPPAAAHMAQGTKLS